MSELKYIASKNGQKYKIVRFEPGSEGKRAKINRKAATVDFSVYPAKFEAFLELTREEFGEISAFKKTKETQLEAEKVKEFAFRYREGLRAEIIAKATEGQAGSFSALIESVKNAFPTKGSKKIAPDRLCFIVEGETERNYISSYARRFGVLNKISIIKPSSHSPADMVKEAAKILAIDELEGTSIKEAWCVFDRDGHKTYQEAFQLAAHNPRIRICWSNPCIELWFLMHYQELPCGLKASKRFPVSVQTQVVKVSENMEKEITERLYYLLYDPEQTLHALLRKWPSYKKNGLGYAEELHPKLTLALQRFQSSEKNPNRIGSCFPVLLEALAAIDGKSLEDFAVSSSEDNQLLALEEEIVVARRKYEDAREGYLLAKDKRVRKNCDKTKIHEINQANCLKKAEMKLNCLMEQKNNLFGGTQISRSVENQGYGGLCYREEENNPVSLTSPK